MKTFQNIVKLFIYVLKKRFKPFILRQLSSDMFNILHTRNVAARKMTNYVL